METGERGSVRNVLLAYERDQDLVAVETLLHARGYHVRSARSGTEALELARHAPPHVVVADVLLPRLDGFALCRRIKEDDALRGVPVVLHSFRIEGPKYEAFAAEVGAERFVPRGAPLEEVAKIVAGDATVAPAERAATTSETEIIRHLDQDREHLLELERRARELDAANQQLQAAERAAREQADREARERAELAAQDMATIRSLQDRIVELEGLQERLAETEQRARNIVQESRAELARVTVLEARLAELQASRARAQAARVDADRVLASYPLPTWLVDMETLQLHAASDSACALMGVPRDQAGSRPLGELLPGVTIAGEPDLPIRSVFERPDGRRVEFDLLRQSVAFAGRACWLLVARNANPDAGAARGSRQLAAAAAALWGGPEAHGLLDAEGRVIEANEALARLAHCSAAELVGRTLLEEFELPQAGDEPVPSGRASLPSADEVREARWRRRDGSVAEVELRVVDVPGAEGLRSLVVRDAGPRRRAEARAARDVRRGSALIELARRADALPEAEYLGQGLDLLRSLTRSGSAAAFLCVADRSQLELAVLRSGPAAAAQAEAGRRWRGAPPAGSALHECLVAQRPALRDRSEPTGPLQEAGLPQSLQRQLVVPLGDAAGPAGLLLLADAERPYDEEDRRDAAQVADLLVALLRRGRTDAQNASALVHMERAMLGSVGALATLSELQDTCKSGRARRVGEFAAQLGEALALSPDVVRGLRIAGQLIDVGMTQIPREILWRPGQLSAAEFELVRTHPERGYELLRGIEFPWPVAEAVRQHHERLDGSGYPRALRGEQILVEARILAVADAVEAMLSPRPHRAALSLEVCIAELQSQAGRRYDPRVVKACVQLLGERGLDAGGTAAGGQRVA